MSMSRADHFYDCNWEKYADENGKIDYEKLWRATHNDYDAFSQEAKAEIEVLKARLEKCKSQRDDYIFDENSKANLTDLMGTQIRADNELSAITIDSI
jgi:hypothetical protein